MEENLLRFFAAAPLLVSFCAGALTFFSPCVLPLVPAYLSYISGRSVRELKDSQKLGAMAHLRIFGSAFAFCAGFGAVFVLLGAVAANILGASFLLSSWFRIAAGAVLVAFGLQVLGLFSFRFLAMQKTFAFDEFLNHLSAKARFLRHLAPFALGVSFAFGWTPCVGPIFASIVMLASSDISGSLGLLGAYAVGLGVPFLLCAVFVAQSFSLLSRAKRLLRLLEILAGVFLILIGIAVSSGLLETLSVKLLEIF